MVGDFFEKDHHLILAFPCEEDPIRQERWNEQIRMERSQRNDLRINWLSLRQAPPQTPLPLTVGVALALVNSQLSFMAQDLTLQVKTCTNFLSDAKLIPAILSRPELIQRWPRPILTSCPGAFALHCLTATPQTLPPGELFPDHLMLNPKEDSSISYQYWPPEAATLDVALWARKPLNQYQPQLGDHVVSQVEKGFSPPDILLEQDGQKITLSPGCLAANFLAEKDVRDGLVRKVMAVDAGKHHHEMVGAWRDIKRDGKRHRSAPAQMVVQAEGTIERIDLLAPGTPTQLQLPIGELENTHDSAIAALRRLRGAEGLRHWAALLRLFSVEGGRRGTYRWLLDEHLEAMGYDERQQRDPQVRAQAARMVEFIAALELAIYTPGGTLRERRRLLLETGRFERLEGSEWKLEGIEFQMNERLYGGVRSSTKDIGQNWMPAPIELAKIDHVRSPYAHSLGMLLAIRFRWRLHEQADFIVLSGSNLLTLAGIPYENRRAVEAWDKLRRTLDVLVKVGQCQHYLWEGPGEPWSLDGNCRIHSAYWLTDRVARGVIPEEQPPENDRPFTGLELKQWREKRGLSQRELARRLGVTNGAISMAEAKPSDMLGHKLKSAFLKELFPENLQTAMEAVEDANVSKETTEGV